jgi:hypothetical protein
LEIASTGRLLDLRAHGCLVPVSFPTGASDAMKKAEMLMLTAASAELE